MIPLLLLSLCEKSINHCTALRPTRFQSRNPPSETKDQEKWRELEKKRGGKGRGRTGRWMIATSHGANDALFYSRSSFFHLLVVLSCLFLPMFPLSSLFSLLFRLISEKARETRILLVESFHSFSVSIPFPRTEFTPNSTESHGISRKEWQWWESGAWLLTSPSPPNVLPFPSPCKSSDASSDHWLH